jgi:hypothetical protein
MCLPQEQRTLISAPLDKTREFLAASLGPLHERICGPLDVIAVGLHPDLAALQVA